MKEPKIIPGYENEDLDVAFARGEVDAQVASTGTVVEQDLVNKKLADFHSAVEIPKGRKDARFTHLNLPDIETFAKASRNYRLSGIHRGRSDVPESLGLSRSGPLAATPVCRQFGFLSCRPFGAVRRRRVGYLNNSITGASASFSPPNSPA